MRDDAEGPWTLATDGAARGNPGPAAIAYAVTGGDGRIRFSDAETIGRATNNEAEYRALILGLEELALATDGRVVHVTDSELVVNQLTGAYRIRAGNLRPLAGKAQRLAGRFDVLEHQHVPREDPRIQRVDEMANEALDRDRKS